MKGEFFLFHSNLKNQHSALINLLPTADTTTASFDALGRSTHLADWQKPRGAEGVWTERDRLERSDCPQGGRGGGYQTTMIYLHLLERPGAGAPSPLDFV